jgi:hypothetical protein
MNKEYAPDKWVVVKIEGGEFPLTYKVFACWHGGYLDGDSWKLNSGITKVTKEENFYLFEGYSGSFYRCHENCYGLNMYCYSVLNNIIEKSKEAGVNVEKMPEDTNWEKLDLDVS